MARIHAVQSLGGGQQRCGLELKPGCVCVSGLCVSSGSVGQQAILGMSIVIGTMKKDS